MALLAVRQPPYSRYREKALTAEKQMLIILLPNMPFCQDIIFDKLMQFYNIYI